MAKIDYKKELKHLFKPSTKQVEIVDVPQMNFLMIDGKGDPNTSPEYKDAVEAFKKVLQSKRPDVQFVAEQWPALGKINAGSGIQALSGAKPEAIYNVTFAGDLAKFVREGKLRGFSNV